jgi:hypothetical protein
MVINFSAFGLGLGRLIHNSTGNYEMFKDSAVDEGQKFFLANPFAKIINRWKIFLRFLLY